MVEKTGFLTETEIHVNESIEIDVQEVQDFRNWLTVSIKGSVARQDRYQELVTLSAALSEAVTAQCRFNLWVENGCQKDVKWERWVAATFYP